MNIFYENFSWSATKVIVKASATVSLVLFAGLASEGAYGQPKTKAQLSVQSIASHEYGLKNIKLDFQGHEVASQSRGATVSFPKAFRKAIESILSDGSNASSPLAQSLFVIAADPERPGELQQVSQEEMRAASLLLSKYMDQPSTTLRLATRQSSSSGRALTAQNWVFELRVPSLSDQSFWIVVDKTGSRSTFNYGG